MTRTIISKTTNADCKGTYTVVEYSESGHTGVKKLLTPERPARPVAAATCTRDDAEALRKALNGNAKAIEDASAALSDAARSPEALRSDYIADVIADDTPDAILAGEQARESAIREAEADLAETLSLLTDERERDAAKSIYREAIENAAEVGAAARRGAAQATALGKALSDPDTGPAVKDFVFQSRPGDLSIIRRAVSNNTDGAATGDAALVEALKRSGKNARNRRIGGFLPDLNDIGKARIEVFDPSEGKVYGSFIDFIVASVSETDAERTHIVETFGRPFIFSSGRFVRRYTFAGIVKALPVNWAATNDADSTPQSAVFRAFYDRNLRSTQTARANRLIRVIVDGNVYVGHAIAMSLSRAADNDALEQFSLSFIGVEYQHERYGTSAVTLLQSYGFADPASSTRTARSEAALGQDLQTMTGESGFDLKIEPSTVATVTFDGSSVEQPTVTLTVSGALAADQVPEAAAVGGLALTFDANAGAYNIKFVLHNPEEARKYTGERIFNVQLADETVTLTVTEVDIKNNLVVEGTLESAELSGSGITTTPSIGGPITAKFSHAYIDPAGDLATLTLTIKTGLQAGTPVSTPESSIGSKTSRVVELNGVGIPDSSLGSSGTATVSASGHVTISLYLNVSPRSLADAIWADIPATYHSIKGQFVTTIAARPMVVALKAAGYSDIQVTTPQIILQSDTKPLEISVATLQPSPPNPITGNRIYGFRVTTSRPVDLRHVRVTYVVGERRGVPFITSRVESVPKTWVLSDQPPTDAIVRRDTETQVTLSIAGVAERAVYIESITALGTTWFAGGTQEVSTK
jgi:hypothetical protein